MRCKFCGTDPDPIVLVPNIEKRKDGQIEIFSCLDCAIKQGVYCEKHESPHTGFSGDETTACLHCIEEEVQAKKEVAEGRLVSLAQCEPRRSVLNLLKDNQKSALPGPVFVFSLRLKTAPECWPAEAIVRHWERCHSPRSKKEEDSS